MSCHFKSCPNIHSSIYGLFIHSRTHSFIHSFIHSITHALMPSFIYSPTHALTRFPIPSFGHSLIHVCVLSCFFIHSLTQACFSCFRFRGSSRVNTISVLHSNFRSVLRWLKGLFSTFQLPLATSRTLAPSVIFCAPVLASTVRATFQRWHTCLISLYSCKQLPASS